MLLPLLLLAALGATAAAAAPAPATTAEPLSALGRMPVREITIFKDGHAFVLHEGEVPTDAAGHVPLDYLPAPVLGTFWPYSADKAVRLTSVTASARRTLVERTALTLRDLVEANPGARIEIPEPDGKGGIRALSAQIIGIPARTSEELEATNPPGSPPALPQEGEVVLLKTPEGDLVWPLNRLQTATFKGEYRRTVAEEEFRNRLTLHLDWAGKPAARTARVGMMYLQKGVRWIPGYKVVLDGKSRADLTLQATLLNEMTDLQGVTANLVIGVPTFTFKDTVDPMALQQTLARLSQYFQTDSQAAGALSNAIMTQAARATEVRRERPVEGGDLGPEVAGSGQNEDLFLFTVKNVSLKRGERMVVPVSEYALKYRDVFTLEVPFGPPAELRRSVNTSQQAELERLLNAPRVMHVARIGNTGKHPLTTAPALIVAGERVLGQGMMTYTSAGGEVDLGITAAPDVKVKKSEKETGRAPRALTHNGDAFARVDLQGTLTLTNYRAEPAEVEVTRYVLGHVDEADHNGKAEMLNAFEDGSGLAVPAQPYWWGWYSWPSWWSQVNGRGRFTWTVTIEPGKSVDLGYRWHYFWR
ncbi:MAG: hypothetical protein HY321_19335 [Armatimonadetes bacterium]|nr:hypothetical protein [Armatimonadota bacterium]